MKKRTAVIAVFVSLMSSLELFVIPGSVAKPICNSAKGAEFYNQRAKDKVNTGDLIALHYFGGCQLISGSKGNIGRGTLDKSN